MLGLNPQIGLYLYCASSTFWIWSIRQINYAFKCTEKVAGGSKWPFSSFLTIVDKFLYTLWNMPYAVPSSAGSLLYSRMHMAARWMGGICWALSPPWVWALCIEPYGANTRSILGPANSWLLFQWLCQIMFTEYVSSYSYLTNSYHNTP